MLNKSTNLIIMPYLYIGLQSTELENITEAAYKIFNVFSLTFQSVPLKNHCSI